MKSTLFNRCPALLIAAVLCLSSTIQAQPTADFSASATSGCAPLRVEFDNNSTNSIEWDWNFGDGATSDDENPVHFYSSPGNYTVVLTAYGAGAADTETKVNYITVSGFEVEVEVTHASCGLSNGSIDVTVVGSAAAYSWSNGATTQDLNGLAVGNYRVTITDSSGCVFTETYRVENTNNLSLSVVKTHVSTAGGSDGAIDLSVAGGTPPYSYLWNNGETTQDLANLPAGNYCVLVTDSNGCAEDGCFLIEQLNPCADFEVNFQITDASCGSANGGINLTVTGGAPPYSYSWSNGSDDQDLSNLAQGSYRVTVEDTGGCRFTETFIVESSGNITITGSVSHVVPGVRMGAIELTVTGGSSPYSYSWSNGETGRIVDGLAAGTYCVTVTDASGCSADKCFLIETAQGCNLVITGSVRDATPGVADGRIEPFVSGGTAPYSYSWSNGSNDRVIENLPIGTYCVSVTDASGCSANHCFNVEAASGTCSMSVSGTVTDVSGPDQHDGRINITIVGGTSPYTYSWDNGETSRNIDGLENGRYCVTVTDINGCVADRCFMVEVEQGGCGDFSFAFQITDASCGASNGSINLIVTGGTPPYSYTWTNGSTDEDLYNLAAGSYRFTVTDSAGCDLHETLHVETAANNLSISASITDVSASGAMDGAISLTVTGGTPPYSYNWTHGDSTQNISGLEVGTYCILVVDANGCAEDGCFNVEGVGCNDFTITGNVGNDPCGAAMGYINITVHLGTPPYFYIWSNGDTTEDLFSIPAGNYTVTVEDNGSCRTVKTFTVGHAGGFQITGVVTPSVAGAATGAITISMSGGTPPFTFDWSNGETTQNIDNLAPGQYCVLVTDSAGCIEDKCFTVGTTGGCGAFYVTAWDDISLCEPGTVTLEANAFEGELPYSFSWSTGSDDRITQVQVTATTTFSVTATDDNGCTSTDSVTVFVVNSTSTMGVTSDSFSICRGDTVQLAAFGGDTYYWDPGNGLSDRNSATPLASPEETKDYWVRIEDGTCHATFWVHVEVDEDCVWPGDANSDGIANNNDVLAIGIGNGISGFPRPNATNTWEGQYCPDWFLALASGPNLKHVDCDGDGAINTADTLPIFLNYGLTHNKSGGRVGQKFVDPELYFDLPDDTALAGQHLDVPVYLGTNDLQVSNFYGIAFTVEYDGDIVEENTMSFAPVNSFAGNVGDLLSFDYDMYGEEKMDVALTRLNRVSVGGWGQIGTISFTMKDDISGKDFLVLPLLLSFSDVRAIDNNENEMTLFYDGGTIYVKQELTGIAVTNNDPDISVYPNPISDVLYISAKNANILEVALMDLLGKEIFRNALATDNTTLDVSNLPAGSYLLKIKMAEGEAVRRVVVGR